LASWAFAERGAMDDKLRFLFRKAAGDKGEVQEITLSASQAGNLPT
jgi:hypothetical protein